MWRSVFDRDSGLLPCVVGHEAKDSELPLRDRALSGFLCNLFSWVCKRLQALQGEQGVKMCLVEPGHHGVEFAC